MRSVQLGGTIVADDGPPYVIAEIGVNHEGSMKQARELIRLAKQGGADAAKFQTYKADTLASRHSPAYWDLEAEPTATQYALFKKYDSFGPEEYRELSGYCAETDIDFLSTPFDNDAVAFLDPLMPFYKVASADITNLPLLENVGARGKPVLLSTGAATLAEVDMAVQVLYEAGCGDVVLLHCILSYPTLDGDAHLGMIEGLRRTYPEHVIGYSDHSVPDRHMTALTTAYLLGARVIEKHFTHDKSLSGNDHYHAMDVDDLQRLRQRLEHIRTFVGPTRHKHPIRAEDPARFHARRSIVLGRAVQSGQALTQNVLTCKRPGSGISPVHWSEVLGRNARRDLPQDHVLRWEDVEERSRGESTTGDSDE